MTVIIIADGAEWIWKWAEKYEKAVKILDYYHLKEHLYQAGTALYGEDSLRVRQWGQALGEPVMGRQGCPDGRTYATDEAPRECARKEPQTRGPQGFGDVSKEP